MHERVGPRMRLRRSKLQQRLRGTLPQRLDPASWAVPRHSGGSNRRNRSSLWHRQRRTLLDRSLLPLHTGNTLRHDKQTGQMPSTPPSLHGRLQSRMRLRRKDVLQCLLRKRRGCLGETKRRMPPVKAPLRVAHGASPPPLPAGYRTRVDQKLVPETWLPDPGSGYRTRVDQKLVPETSPLD